MSETKPLRFTIDDAQKAADAWRFNCGPASLCAVLDMTPDEIRPHLLDFEAKGYTNPTLMADILHGLNVPFRRLFECAVKVGNYDISLPRLGFCRVQWGGPWCNPGVPMAARYRHTHWIGIRHRDSLCPSREVFDVNVMCSGGWLPWAEWATELVPWLIKEAVPQADGTWWPTHCWEVQR